MCLRCAGTLNIQQLRRAIAFRFIVSFSPSAGAFSISAVMLNKSPRCSTFLPCVLQTFITLPSNVLAVLSSQMRRGARARERERERERGGGGREGEETVHRGEYLALLSRVIRVSRVDALKREVAEWGHAWTCHRGRKQIIQPARLRGTIP